MGTSRFARLRASRRSAAFGIVSLLVLAAACGGDDNEGPSQFDSGTGDDGGGVTFDASGGGGAEGGFGGGGDGSTTCPSSTLCGATATCCAVGQECYDEACVAACASGVHCGSTCCNSGDVCLSAACVTPTTTCDDSFDCADNEFCEPTLGKCLPQPTGPNLCVIQPPTPAFAPVVKWSWTDSTINPGYNQIINTPSIVDLDGDKFPEVVVVTSKNDSSAYSQTGVAFVRALDGRDGTEKWAATVDAYKHGVGGDPDYSVGPRDTPAVADIDGDGHVDIVAARRNGGLIAFNGDGSLKWVSTKHDGTTPYTGSFLSMAIAIADMDNDGKAEIVAGGVVVDYQGHLVSDSLIGRELYGSNDTGYGPVSVIADVDGDPTTHTQYVVTGNRAYEKDGTTRWDVSATLHDGYPAIADLDKDGTPELVVTYSTGGVGYIRVQNATTGAIIGSPLQVPGTGRGGPPTIADFDGDGFMEIASANGNKYNVFEFDQTTKVLSAKWSAGTQDLSSNVTGSSVFDFEGDGASEVGYNDECYSRVYNGGDGGVLLQIPNSTATIHEYPVIADVNGDNHTEYVVVANDVNHLNKTVKCAAEDGGVYTPNHGIYVYGDPADKWVRTRKVWNEHAYHITNVNGDGTLPVPEDLSWGPNGLNNYRVSSQGKGVFNAPDLKVSLEISTKPCPTGIELRARVENDGSLGVPAGVSVDFYLGTSASGTFLAEKKTVGALLPGASEIVSYTFVPGAKSGPFQFFVTVDGNASASTVDAGTGGSLVAECNEDNNSGGAGGVSCPNVR